MAKYRTALIGLSWIATDPAPPASDPVLGTSIPYSHAAALAAIPEVEVVAGCDIAPAMRTQFLERWQHRWPEAKVYEDYRELLAKEKPDLVTIATPDFLHADPFIQAVEAGAKGIFVEKPLATSMDDANRMVEAARKAGVVVNVDFTRRWMPQYVAARVQVDKGRIGKLSQIIIEIGGERAMLWRNHPHATDLMAYYAGRRSGMGRRRARAGLRGLRHRVQGRRRQDHQHRARGQLLRRVQERRARLPDRDEGHDARPRRDPARPQRPASWSTSRDSRSP